MSPTRIRRVILIFLLLLTAIVIARIASSAEGAVPGRNDSPPPRTRTPAVTGALSVRLEEPGGVLPGGTRLQRTVALGGLPRGSPAVHLAWEAQVDGKVAALGGEVLSPHDGAARGRVSIPLPELDRPAGLDLRLEVRDGTAVAGAATFPFLVYPKPTAETIQTLFGKARVALYDPDARAASPLAALGLHPERIETSEALSSFSGDLIVVGPGGFSRGRETLGPILAERVRSGMRLLLLEQTTLPGTLSSDLRLWPSFTRGAGSDSLLAARHPVLQDLSPRQAIFASIGGSSVRPLLPPTRGNFRIISEMRVSTGPSWEEGVTMLEIPLGAGTVLLAQSPLCSEFAAEPAARLVLANALSYLLGGGRGLKKTFLYGETLEDLPACLARLSPAASRVPDDLSGVEVLLVSGDWRAPRVAASSHLPPRADVARYLRDGGTVLLFNPQPLSIEYLQAVTGVPVRFDPQGGASQTAGRDATLLDGVAPEDLPLLSQPGPVGFRLRSSGETPVEPLAFSPGVAEYRVGRGTLVALSLPDAAACVSPRTSSLLSRLLTNLGVPLDQSPGIDPEATPQP
jgi:hypothetical protein